VSEPKAATGAALLIATAALATIAVATAGCGRVEPLPRPHAGPSTLPAPAVSPSDEAPEDTYPTNSEPPYPGLTTAAPADASAAPCIGRPSAAQVIAALRRDPDLRPPSTNPRVVAGPVCAGSWQYTLLDFPGQGRLQVVSRGGADSLTIVTAGTYVCTPEVKGAAPAGIVAAAHCQ
jgi:predicted small lipoprotein YifL